MSNLLDAINNGLSNAKLTMQQHSPEILMVTGIVGVIATTVIACKATTKISKITEAHKEQMDAVHDQEIGEEYSEEDRNRDTAIIYTKTSFEMVKLYAPAVGLGILSISCLLASNRILSNRNAALTAAYTAVYTSFKEYRGRVIDRFGKEVDHQLRFNVKQEEIEETVTDDKGKEKKVKKKVDVVDPNVNSDYARIFNRYTARGDFDRDKLYMETFFNAQQKIANNMLKNSPSHFLVLNDVYELLGLAKTKIGIRAGWIYDPVNPNGDNYIEFDIKEIYFPNESGELERGYTIDFNVDGDIYDKV